MEEEKKKKESNPSWQDLNPFLLSKIFSFLTLYDKLYSPPFVCRSWLSATLDTIFPNSNLDLRPIDELDEENQRLRFKHLLKLAINRDHTWFSISLPQEHVFRYYSTTYIAERTPEISRVFLPPDDTFDIFPIFMSLSYWKNLRVFHATLRENVGTLLLSQLGDYCTNIVDLSIHGKFDRETLTLVKGFPLLRVLDLSKSTLVGDACLATILDVRLKCVREINVMHCIFIGDDGKDVCEDYFRLKDFKNEMLENVAKFTSLRKFLHCLGIIGCPGCAEKSELSSDKAALN